MTTRYTEKQLADVAFILGCHTTAAGIGNEDERMEWLTWIAKSFANLFAADNPRKCLGCGLTEDSTNHQHQGYEWGPGFNREKFLAACGLESEG